MGMVSFLVVFLGLCSREVGADQVRFGYSQTIRLRLYGRTEFTKGFDLYRIMKAVGFRYKCRYKC